MLRLLTLAAAMIAVADLSAADAPDVSGFKPTAELPDPLLMLDGTKVATKEQWETQRKPELRRLFESYMYGTAPAKPETVTGKVLFENPKAFDGAGTLREVELTVGPAGFPKIYLLMAVPNDRQAPAACFVGPNFSGNHTLAADERIRIPDVWMYPNRPGVKENKATAEGRGKSTDVWPLAEIVKRGYAVATFYNGDLQPDRPNVREGMRATLPAADPAPGNQTATVMLWAWGVQRAVDYLTADKDIDAKRIAAVGHSRLGKTVLLAGALDPRIAVVMPHQSGCGGAGPSRHADPKAESVKRITTAFPHWFCGNFKGYADSLDKLPFDQHELVALCAPRPVLFTNAADDLWANPSGQFAVLRAATPVYKLLGVDGLTADKVPSPGDKLVDDRLGYWIRPGKHEMNRDDWQTFLAYADKWLK